ncbi:hypothetical protein V6N13_072578 [Hibiscus sabdariffa]|uniref:RNase H type-1 domain-containing protein n=1 Tax=Hibiscus sabdariffa TaxID=183260 RepID=A0ABR2R779_9ROSI
MAAWIVIPPRLIECNRQNPPTGWVCLNVDVVVPDSSRLGSIGGVFRDAKCNWLNGFQKSICITNVLQAKLWGFQTARFQLDSSTSVQLIADATTQLISFP